AARSVRTDAVALEREVLLVLGRIGVRLGPLQLLLCRCWLLGFVFGRVGAGLGRVRARACACSQQQQAQPVMSFKCHRSLRTRETRAIKRVSPSGSLISSQI